MKKINLNKKHRKTYKKGLVILGLLLVLILAGLSWKAFKAINAFFETHYFQFNQVIVLNKPIEIKTREVKVSDVVRVMEEQPLPENLTPIEEYICEKFGAFECRVALAIAKSESGLREDAFNTYNTNGTLDVGIFQINSVHFNQAGCSLKEIVDPYKNVDCAFSIYEASGWNAWSAFKSGSFISKLSEK
jgi:hypothetical protein